MDDCPICLRDNTKIIFTKGNLDKDLINVICKNCGLVFINPRPGKEEYDNFHKEEFLLEKSIKTLDNIKPKINESDLKIKKSIFIFLNEYIGEGQNISDIGCGYGTLLNIIRKVKKANVFGVELGNLDVAAAKEYYGLNLFHGSLEQFAENPENWEKFDVIVMHHTFEHLPDPLVSLGQIKKLLKSGGVLYIGVPNIMNLKKRPEIFFQRAHPFSYSPHSLKLMLEKAGFGIIKFNRNAGYPGGMEAVATPNKQTIYDKTLIEGSNYNDVAEYIKNKRRVFSAARMFRDTLLFYMPKKWRVGIGRILYNFLKK